MMNNYEFELQFQLQPEEDPEQYLDLLYEAGCSDATIGIGKKGHIGLLFYREASSSCSAIKKSLEEVFSVIPHAKLHQANPYLQNTNELAFEFGLTKQNMRLYTNNQAAKPDKPFPTPMITGTRTSYWLTIEVAIWLRDQAGFEVSPVKIDALAAIQALNLTINEAKQSQPSWKKSFTAVLKRHAA